MIMDILIPILTLSTIAISVGILMTEFGKTHDDKFDERQLIERGRAANLAMTSAIVYLFGIFAGHVFELLRMEYIAIFAVYGLTVMLLVHSGYCIIHDAYLSSEQELGPEVVRNMLFGVLWMGMIFLSGAADPHGNWIRGALALDYLGIGIMLLLRELIVRMQDRRTEKEYADGEE